LQQATVAAAPVPYGAGVQNKVLEAMACATPVVASTRAASALKVTADCDLIVAVDTPAFAAGLLRLLDNPELRRSVGQAGRTYVERNHSWDSAAAQLEQIYRGAGAAPSQV
jgi:glycosyltransferase involved in cell wall biosynthesis